MAYSYILSYHQNFVRLAVGGQWLQGDTGHKVSVATYMLVAVSISTVWVSQSHSCHQQSHYYLRIREGEEGW